MCINPRYIIAWWKTIKNYTVSLTKMALCSYLTHGHKKNNNFEDRKNDFKSNITKSKQISKNSLKFENFQAEWKFSNFRDTELSFSTLFGPIAWIILLLNWIKIGDNGQKHIHQRLRLKQILETARKFQLTLTVAEFGFHSMAVTRLLLLKSTETKQFWKTAKLKLTIACKEVLRTLGSGSSK